MEVYEKRGYSVNYVLADIAKSNDFPFPDYGGMPMSIQDTCYARKRPDVHETIRLLLQRMNIRIIEPQATCTHSKCCGHALYGKAATDKVEELMRKRAGEMPCDDVWSIARLVLSVCLSEAGNLITFLIFYWMSRQTCTI